MSECDAVKNSETKNQCYTGTRPPPPQMGLESSPSAIRGLGDFSGTFPDAPNFRKFGGDVKGDVSPSGGDGRGREGGVRGHEGTAGAIDILI